MNEEELPYTLQYRFSTPLKVDGFRSIITSFHGIVSTNRITSKIVIDGIGQIFWDIYKEQLSDYIYSLESLLSSLCRMIMMEEDDKLTGDALLLKKELLNCFEKI